MHTPGPWKKQPEAFGRIAISESNGRWDICYVNLDSNEGEDNARLIEAAPDLLEALEELLNNQSSNDEDAVWVDKEYNETTNENEYAFFLTPLSIANRKARTAIKKTKNE